jgi:hypothetical protein
MVPLSSLANNRLEHKDPQLDLEGLIDVDHNLVHPLFSTELLPRHCRSVAGASATSRSSTC